MQVRQYNESLWPALQSGMNLSGGGLCSGKTTIDRIYSYLPDVASPGRMTVKHGVGNMLSIQKKQSEFQNTRPSCGFWLSQHASHFGNTFRVNSLHFQGAPCRKRRAGLCSLVPLNAHHPRKEDQMASDSPVILKTWRRWTQPLPNSNRDCVKLKLAPGLSCGGRSSSRRSWGSGSRTGVRWRWPLLRNIHITTK